MYGKLKEFLTNAPKKFVEIIKEKANMLNILKQKTIRLILLQDCMYNCEFCHKEGIKTKKESLMTPEDIGYMFSVLNNRYGIKTVQLTGGEPLLKENLKEIITNLRKHGANIKITTNGYLLRENMWIGEMIDKLNISLHSFNEKKYESITTVENSYERVVSAINKIRFKYPTLKMSINTTLLKGINDNFASIQELISFASSIKADLKIVEVYPKTSRYFTSIFNIEPYTLMEIIIFSYKCVLVVLYLNKVIKQNFARKIMIYLLVKMEELTCVEQQMIQ